MCCLICKSQRSNAYYIPPDFKKETGEALRLSPVSSVIKLLSGCYLPGLKGRRLICSKQETSKPCVMPRSMKSATKFSAHS